VNNWTLMALDLDGVNVRATSSNEQQRAVTGTGSDTLAWSGQTNTMTSTYMSQQGLPDRRRFPTGWTECRPPAGDPAAAA
jgi:hypothetical protein